MQSREERKDWRYEREEIAKRRKRSRRGGSRNEGMQSTYWEKPPRTAERLQRKGSQDEYTYQKECMSARKFWEVKPTHLQAAKVGKQIMKPTERNEFHPSLH